MKITIRENKEYTIVDILRSFYGSSNTPILKEIKEKVIFTGTGRAALKIILDFLKIQDYLKDKNTEILVPQWLCLSVYQTIHKICFPVLTPTKNTKAVFVYHQYGFPQNMDKIMEVAQRNKWAVIEDCANTYESYYKKRRLGTFGLASIFSFSKMFPSIQSGALVSKNSKLINYAKKAITSDNDLFISILAHLSRIMCEKWNSPFWGNIQEMVYATIDSAKKASPLSLNLIKKDLAKRAMIQRKENYHFLIDYFNNYPFFAMLEKKDVIPYVAPLITDENRLEKIKRALLSAGIRTDIYHFDINRNLLNPKFVKCVWVPIHQGLTNKDMFKICKIIKAAVG